MDNNETLKDIVKWLRGTKARNAVRRTYALTLADRIEAAWQRDRSDAMKTAMMAKCEVCHYVQGNKATLRKALEEARDFAKQIEGKTGEADVADDAGEIVELCEEALKAPPRNCERFASWEEAKAAFWKEVGDPCDWRKLGAWLFAKIEKEEGAE